MSRPPKRSRRGNSNAFRVDDLENPLQASSSGTNVSRTVPPQQLNALPQVIEDPSQERIARLEDTIRRLTETVENLQQRPQPDPPVVVRPAAPAVYKLPDVPSFTGDSKDYVSWFNTFEALIISQGYPDRLKFEALKKSIRTVPMLSYMQSWTGTAEDMNLALERIKKLFGDDSKIGLSLLKAVRDAPRIKERDATSAQHLSTVFQAAVEHGNRTNTILAYESQLRDAVLAKLPDSSRAYLSREPGAVKTLQQLQDSLDQAVEAFEQYGRLTGCSSTEHQSSSSSSRPAKHQQFRATHSNKIDHRPHGCPFDGQRHQLRHCPLTYDQRMNIVESKKLCKRCLKPDCDVTNCVGIHPCMFCQEGHHSYICKNLKSTQVVNSSTVQSEGFCFKTGLLNIGQSQPARALFDQGSGKNFMTVKLAKRLGLDLILGPKLHIYGFGADNCTVSSTYSAIWINTTSGKSVRICFCVVPSIGNPSYPSPPIEILEKLPHDERALYRDDHSLPVELIVGLGTCQLLLQEERIFYRNDTHIYSVQSFGSGVLVFGGPIDFSEIHVNVVYPELIAEVDQSTVEPSDNYVDSFVDTQVNVAEDRIQVTVPVTGRFLLESNAKRCLNRVKASAIHWARNGKLTIVTDILNEWLNTGIIEPAVGTNPRTRYMPYHVVSRPDSNTTKHRLVHDGSAEDSQGRSLNDYLFKGITSWDLIRSLINIRLFKHPLLGDLSKAFLQVLLDSNDRDLFRFWWPDPTSPTPYRFCRVPFGTSASPFLLFAAIRKIGKLTEINDFDRMFYVDDLAFSFNSQSECQKVKDLCEQGLAKYGFKINWKEEDETKVLGLRWNRSIDSMSIKIPELSLPTQLRDLASIVARVFDPLGILSPVMAALRRKFSVVWKSGKRWEDSLPAEDQVDVKPLLDYLTGDRIFDFPRWLGMDQPGGHSFHVYCDASLQSIGTVVYSENVTQTCLTIIYAKSILHAKNSIDEAELDAISLGVKSILKLLPGGTHKVTLWTDSELNFKRLKQRSINRLNYKQARKVLDIHSSLIDHNVQVGFVPGKDNPADWLTKLSIRKFDWTKWTTPIIPTVDHCSTLSLTIRTDSDPLDYQLLQDDIDEAVSLNDLLTNHQLESLIIAEQQRFWSAEISALHTHGKLRRKSTLGNYYYFIRKGILTTQVRANSRYVVVLPVSSRLAWLIVDKIHLDRLHPGFHTLLVLCNSEYFIRGMKSIVNSIIHRCETCTRLHGRPAQPTLGPLPKVRITVPTKAFSRIGIDFAGPIGTLSGPRSILVVTCLNSRAIYLRLVRNQDAKSVVDSLRVFSSIYGAPEYVYSDNAKYFCKASAFLKRMYSLVPECLSTLTWNYSFPGSPPSNGVTEAMVGATKRSMRALTFGKEFSDSDLEVFLSEAALVINNRPLFTTDTEVITPSHLIFGTSTKPLPAPSKTHDGPLDARYMALRRRFRGYWLNWKKEYLNIRLHQQLSAPQVSLEVGDRVLYEPVTATNKFDWLVAEVVKVYPGKLDSQVRLVDLRFTDGKELLRRPVDRIIPLESSSRGGEAVKDFPTPQ